jgi:hypothetical protein
MGVRQQSVVICWCAGDRAGMFRRDPRIHGRDFGISLPELDAACGKRLSVSALISWSASSAERHSSKRSAGRVSSRAIVRMVAMGMDGTRCVVFDVSAKGHVRREIGRVTAPLQGGRRQLQGKKRGRLFAGPGNTRSQRRGERVVTARVGCGFIFSVDLLGDQRAE